jgi:hypothetical protein
MRRPHDAGVVDTDIHEQLVELDVLLGVGVHEVVSTRARVARASLESREMVESDAAGVAGAQLARSASLRPPP